MQLQIQTIDCIISKQPSREEMRLDKCISIFRTDVCCHTRIQLNTLATQTYYQLCHGSAAQQYFYIFQQDVYSDNVLSAFLCWALVKFMLACCTSSVFSNGEQLSWFFFPTVADITAFCASGLLVSSVLRWTNKANLLLTDQNSSNVEQYVTA